MSTYSSAAERNKNAQVPQSFLSSIPLFDHPFFHDAMLMGLQLATGYDEVARSLFADELSTVGNYEIGEMIGKGNSILPSSFPGCDSIDG